MTSLIQTPQANAAPSSFESLMDEIEHMWGLFIGILDEIDDQIELVDELESETHFLEVRAETLRDQISSTFSRLRHAGNNDRAWDEAMGAAGTVYESLVALRKDIMAEIEILNEERGAAPQPLQKQLLH